MMFRMDRFDALLLLEADDIPYGELPDELLRRLVFDQDNQFVATSALGELAQRGKVREAALEVIAN